MDQNPELEGQEPEETALEETDMEDEDDDYPRVEGAGMRWLRRLAAEQGSWRWVLAEGSGLLGGALLLASSFLITTDLNGQYAIRPGILTIGLVLIVGSLLAGFWRDSAAGSILCLTASGLMVFGLSYMVEGGDIGPGGYLAFAGGWLGVAAGLVLLIERKNWTQGEMQEQDEHLSDLGQVVEALVEVWDEADKFDQALSDGKPPAHDAYRAVSAKAEKALDDYADKWGA